MRFAKLFLFALSLLLCACLPSLKAGDKKQLLFPNLTYENYTMIHTFRAKDGVELGRVFVKPLNSEVFVSLVITNATNIEDDILYVIDSTKLFSKKGIDTEVAPEGFYGYKIVLKKDDYIVLTYLSNGGKNVSDDLTIAWNYNLKIFELMKTP